MAEDVIDSLPTHLRDLRIARGLTQEEFAEKSGISYKYYQAIEAGRKRDLRLSTILRIAGAHSIEPWQLLNFVNIKKNTGTKNRVRSNKVTARGALKREGK